MGYVKLTMLDKTILFLLSPIILPLGIVCFAGFYLIEKIDALLHNDNHLSPHPLKDENVHHRLYKYLTLGDTIGFTRILKDLAANKQLEINQILSSYLTPQKNTFLHVVSSCENHGLAITILKKSPLLMFKQNDDGDTPLHIAAKAGKSDLVRAFLDFENEIRVGGRAFHRLAADVRENGYRFLNSIMNNQGNTALHEALINTHIQSAQLLIEMDSEVIKFFDLVNKENKSPLYLAVEAGYVELVNIIKQKAVVFNDLVVCLGKSPMHAAILTRSKEILETLSNMRLNIINPKNEKGETPLHYATSIGYSAGVCFLLGKSPTDAYQPDEDGAFPIHSAASKGFVSIIEEFIQGCPDSVELLNKIGQNILHIAAKCGRDNVVKYVLKNRMLKMLINLKDNNGDTPLLLATKYRHPMVVSTLTWDKRTRLELVNNEGFTVLDIAEGNMDGVASFHGRLTWIALKSAGAQRAQNLHVFPRKKDQQMLHSGQMNGGSNKLNIFNSFKDRVNTLLLVTTLVATVTFAAGFTFPGGFNNSDPNQGMATMLAKLSLQTFVICDTIAMYCSIIVAVTLIWAQLGDLNLIRSAFEFALPMLGIALIMMSIAFTAGVYTVVSNLHWLGGVVLGIGGIFEAIVLVLFVPLFFPSQSTNIVARYITYYPFRFMVLASGKHNEELEE